jgi:putative transposase
MNNEGLRASSPPKFVVTTDADHDNPIAENLLNRNFTVNELGKV